MTLHCKVITKPLAIMVSRAPGIRNSELGIQNWEFRTPGIRRPSTASERSEPSPRERSGDGWKSTGNSEFRIRNSELGVSHAWHPPTEHSERAERVKPTRTERGWLEKHR